MTIKIEKAPHLQIANEDQQQILEGFKVNKTQLLTARDCLHVKDMTFMDTFRDSNGKYGLKGAAKAAAYIFSCCTVLFGAVWTGVKLQEVENANKARKLIRNPVDFTRQINALSFLGESNTRALDGALGQERYLPEEGKFKSQQKDHVHKRNLVNTFREKTIPQIEKAIDHIVATSSTKDRGEMNKDQMRRALYATLVAQATITPHKSEFSKEKEKGLDNTSNANTRSGQELAIQFAKNLWKKGNARFAAQDIADNIKPGKVTPETAEDVLKKAAEQLRENEHAILAKAREIVELSGVPEERKAQEVGKEEAAIKKEYIKEVRSKLLGQIKPSIEAIKKARDIQHLQASFLQAKESELKGLAGSGEKGEKTLEGAIEFLSVSPAQQEIMTKAFNEKGKGISSEDLKSINEGKKQNARAIQESLGRSTNFLENLEEDFANYVAEREEEALAHAHYITALLNHSTLDQGNEEGKASREKYESAVASLIEGGEFALEEEGLKVKGSIPKVDPNDLSGGDSINIDPNKLRDLLKIVVGDGNPKSKPGSPMLATALLKSLKSKEASDQGYTNRLEELLVHSGVEPLNTEALKAQLTREQAQLDKLDEDCNAAEKDLQAATGLLRNASNHGELSKKKDHLIGLYNAQFDRVEVLEADLSKAQAGKVSCEISDYVVEREASDSTDEARKTLGALREVGLTQVFAESESLKQLRIALGLIKKDSKDADELKT